MTTPDAEFEYELEVFRSESAAATQFFHAHLSVHEVAAKHESVRRLLNQAPLFWNTCLGALQTAAFVALGRIFDQDSRSHNIDRLLRLGRKHPEIFSKEALARRKQGADPEPPEWLDDYLRDVYEPTKEDFRRIRARVKEQREIYDKNYRDLRHKVFAHKQVTEQEEVSTLFARTNVGELQRLLTFLGALSDALWQLFFNGREPVLDPAPAEQSDSIQKRIATQVEQFLVNCATAPSD